MRDSDFEYIRSLVYERSRISLDPAKRELVDARVAKRLRARRMTSVAEYCSLLRDPGQEEERSHLIDVISTNHTFFFREPKHFDFLRDRVITEMIGRYRREKWPALRVWSAGCSSGEEPYSLAMILSEGLAASPWRWRVEATDIAKPMLEIAEAGIYPRDAVQANVPVWARRYFQRGVGPQEGRCRIRPALRAAVHFDRGNLLEESAPSPEPYQVIFCRNVMIYFDRPTQAELVRKLSRALVPGGYFFVGHSESLAPLDHGLELVQPSIYRKPAAP
ncbi:MAG TPA: protein-glutamate O-methyltransferase CheR [Opitutaceae bacterium]|jgi:chemotaxis protein methyltransferase CheR|nr:protein-glutamate O-methyltransferase CheR [Opitutaceae bacterium]